MLVPGSTFGTYTWGFPSDEPLQFLSNTDIEWRNLIPLGTSGYIQMLDAVETVLDNGISTPGLAEYLARGGVKYVIERNDLNWQTTGAPPPAQVHQVLSDTSGLTQVAAFGPHLKVKQAENSALPVYESAFPTALRAVEIFEVQPASSVLQTYPASNPVIVSGNVGSLLPLAGAGLLNGRATVLSGDPKAQGVDREGSATWAITDGNQLRDTGFGSLRYNDSYILSPGEVLPSAPPNVPTSFQVVDGLEHETVEDPVGAASVSASSYGSSYLIDDPAQGPASAFDNERSTAWVADAADHSIGQWVAITFPYKIPMSHITLSPLRGGRAQPVVSRVTITTDNGSVVRTIPPGVGSVRLSLRAGRSHYLRVTIDAVRGGLSPAQNGGFVVGAGIANIAIPGVKFEPRMKVPSDEIVRFRGSYTQPTSGGVQQRGRQPQLLSWRAAQRRSQYGATVRTAKSGGCTHQWVRRGDCARTSSREADAESYHHLLLALFGPGDGDIVARWPTDVSTPEHRRFVVRSLDRWPVGSLARPHAHMAQAAHGEFLVAQALAVGVQAD